LPPIDVESSYNHAVYLNDHKLKSFYEIGQRFRLLAEMAQKYQSEALDSGYAGYQHQQDPDEVGYQSFAGYQAGVE
jgi:hypothetical protein